MRLFGYLIFEAPLQFGVGGFINNSTELGPVVGYQADALEHYIVDLPAPGFIDEGVVQGEPVSWPHHHGANFGVIALQSLSRVVNFHLFGELFDFMPPLACGNLLVGILKALLIKDHAKIDLENYY